MGQLDDIQIYNNFIDCAISLRFRYFYRLYDELIFDNFLLAYNDIN